MAPDEQPAVSDRIRTLQAVSTRKAEIVAKLSALDLRKLKLRQEKEQIEREQEQIELEEAQMHDEMRALTSQEMRSLAPEQADASREPSRGHKRRADSLSSVQATPKRTRTLGIKASISFKQLRDYVDDLKQQGPSGQLQCPRCVTKKNGFKTLVRHLYEHLDTKEHYFYKCPFDGCDYRAVRLEHVKAHAANRAHNAAWTDVMNSRCVVQGNLDCYTAMCR
ncbi:hypothetical protein AAVH_19526 [Aphelenchoides avenae]|nr:hypothetical protein AAVH_19526 [Aphelenchus avenae]